ncbi:interleukin-26 [Pagrus major]|uniref:interleukin-26 n=1 Tax=Pagrus major TaxID=143350 RepID=UPI003CC89120
MFLLLVRTAALALLLSFTVTAERDVTCRQEVPAELIRDLWNRSQQLIKRLPREEKISRRLLPKFCTKCPERMIGWLEMQEVMDVYQRSVFSTEVIRKLLPLHYEDLLYRLQQTLQHCVSSSEPSRWFQLIKEVEKKIKRRRDKQALKAVREFNYVLSWISELAQNHNQ